MLSACLGNAAHHLLPPSRINRNLWPTVRGTVEIEEVPKVWDKVHLVNFVFRDVDGVVCLLPRRPRRK